MRVRPSARARKQGAEIIERNARIQTQIIEDLLDMSRIVPASCYCAANDEPRAVGRTALARATAPRPRRGLRRARRLLLSGDPKSLQRWCGTC